MPAVVFEASAAGAAVTASAPIGAEIREVCDRVAAPVPFGCRSATCGTCLVEVLDGAELLDPSGPAERALLATLGAPADHRLACQAAVRAEGRIHLRAVQRQPAGA